METTTKFQIKPLSRLGGPADFATYRAGLEWDLAEPIVIEGKDDFRSTPRWRERLDPYSHQVSNLITFCRRLPVTLLADDVGLGKTISAGLIISELVARARLNKVLIVCPKILGVQWRDELKGKFDISAIVATGRDLLTADPGDTGAVITTYNSARIYLEQLPEDRFEMLVLDEAHKLRNLYGTADAPKVAKCFHKALGERRFRYVLMLTATPIQNRLWDLYSLVDLLTVARGHENPFGNTGTFARRFIDDSRETARRLKPEARDEFRHVVYSYMSRVRRGDAKLAFPTRFVRMHPLKPTQAELDLIDILREPIQKMNRLAQISILQALASSPDALNAQLRNMARNGTAPPELASAVKSIVESMPPSAKLVGLGKLIESLKQQEPESWRLVVFTTRRETQTTIQNFLERHGLKVGIINGESGERNQDTIAKFRENPPGYRVIVSTEAGSEGVNLQVANVLVNFDLPWNPMIVEQRIGRIQRLASVHEKVSIFNVMLQGTFEEYIVGRLMEKLQLAAHAIGDIEALLQGTDVDNDGDGDSGETFEDRILDLVLAALAKRDVKRDVELAVKSIDEAKKQLEREEANINSLLGGMEDAGYIGPRAPTLPTPTHSMTAKEFTLSAFPMLKTSIREERPGIFFAEGLDIRERIRFDAAAEGGTGVTLYASQTPAFQRLVKRVIASGMHNVEDSTLDLSIAENAAKRWSETFGASSHSASMQRARRSFQGKALLRVRATVAHDSYERLISVDCDPNDHFSEEVATSLTGTPKTIRDPNLIGIKTDKLLAAAKNDDAISEFRRFYEERRELEVLGAGTDARKRKKLEDEFTPNLEVSLVGLEGTAKYGATYRVGYRFDDGQVHESELDVDVAQATITASPPTELCSLSGKMVPIDCLDRCAITGAPVIGHLLVKSELSGRRALPEFVGTCAVSGKRALQDEMEISATTGRTVAKDLLKSSGISGKQAELDQFGVCAFTGVDALTSELATSEISGKLYRIDEAKKSDISERTGHKSELFVCSQTRKSIAADEADTCEASGSKVVSGLLETCEVTNKRVVPSLLVRCAATGKMALSRLLVSSSISHAKVLRDHAIKARSGAFCLPAEAITCFWSERDTHPEDIRKCGLTGLSIHVEFAVDDGFPRLRALAEMLDGLRHNTDEETRWDHIAERLGRTVKSNKCRIEAAVLSPTKQHIATCAEEKRLLGLQVTQLGAVYAVDDDSIIGRIARGKRSANGWIAK